MNLKKTVFLLAIVMVLNVGSAFAVPLSITNILGGWQNDLVPGVATIVNLTGQSQDTVRWGIPAVTGGSQSGYNFTPSTDIVAVLLGTPFLLGTFQHVNQPIFPPALTSIDYSLSFSTNGSPSSLGTVFHFAHNETPNTGPCAAGPDGPSTSVCDDFVTVTTSALNQQILVPGPGGTDYFFNLLGFSKDGAATIKSVFQSPENGTNTIGLYALVTGAPIGIPEPDALLLLGTGLGGVALFARRLKKS